jgi:hypothetical protein
MLRGLATVVSLNQIVSTTYLFFASLFAVCRRETKLSCLPDNIIYFSKLNNTKIIIIIINSIKFNPI